MAALTDQIDRLAQQDGLRALLLTGAGSDAFVGGADIAEMARLDPVTARTFIRTLADLCQSVRRFPAPVVACLHGWCLGGGLELAMACDFRIAHPAAQFGMPEVKVGIPSVIHAALLPRLVGPAHARWMLLTGATIDAPTAHAWGL